MKYAVIAVILAATALGACRREVPYTPMYEEKYDGYYK